MQQWYEKRRCQQTRKTRKNRKHAGEKAKGEERCTWQARAFNAHTLNCQKEIKNRDNRAMQPRRRERKRETIRKNVGWGTTQQQVKKNVNNEPIETGANQKKDRGNPANVAGRSTKKNVCGGEKTWSKKVKARRKAVN